MYMGENPKALLSQSLLNDGLLLLMERKSYTKINIKELCAYADVSRQTFYKLFQTKDELLVYCIDAVLNKIVKKISENTELDTSAMVSIFVQIFTGHERFANIIVKNALEMVLINRFMLAVKRLFTIIPLAPEKVSQEYYAAFYTGGLSNILFCWCRSESRISPEELTKVICALIHD